MKPRPQTKTPAKKTSLSRKEAEAVIRKEAKHVTQKDLEKVLSKSEDIRRKFERGGPLGKFIDDFKLLIAVIQDYWKGKYREVPFWTVAAIVCALLYVLNPLDLIPDVIPVIGYLDDAAVVAACLALVRQDLHNYKEWKMAHAD
jgi:uncharacterized membrane protein YkvA (DUF1232 family)